MRGDVVLRGLWGWRVRCNGRGKPTPLRKVGGLGRIWKGWGGERGGDNPSVLRQIGQR